uniref:uncharacterized protein C7orf57 homolog n=1 Tax=Styela clava TaxID=7725 RepID=UPI001939C1A0|nr:uncharacterized protein C7orf57 homolog [Styela clava]
MLANSGQMWFYHAPSKRTEKPQKLAPAASQIPGLAALDPLDQEAWEREVGIKSQKQAKESDSHYIRLAKQGGRKNLLTFRDIKPPSEEIQPYPRVDWFDHHDCDPEKDKRILSQSTWQPPEYMVHDYETTEKDKMMEDEEIVGRAKPRRAPFYSDNMSAWSRPEEDNPKRNKKRKSQIKVDKLPELPLKTQKSPPVAFSKLIGGEYGTEWYRKQATQGQSKAKFTQYQSGKGYLNMTEYQQNICRKVIPPKKLKPISMPQQKKETNQEKPMFKLSKFSKVESKLNTVPHET